MDFFDDWIKERGKGRVRKVRASVDTDGTVNNFAATEDALLEGTVPVIFLVLELVPDLSREMLGQERSCACRELWHTCKLKRIE